jgi:hypothetical protein
LSNFFPEKKFTSGGKAIELPETHQVLYVPAALRRGGYEKVCLRRQGIQNARDTPSMHVQIVKKKKPPETISEAFCLSDY